MKKSLLTFAVMLTGAALFTACDDNDSTQEPVPVIVSNGAYIVCGGNQSSNVNGSLSYIDYATGTAAQKVFYNNNGRELGLTPNDAVVYGSKMYIVVTEENTVEVVDAKTLRSVKQIKTPELMGADKGVAPRHITAANGLVYFTTYGGSTSTYDENWNAVTSGNGYVAAIDTTTYSLKQTYTAGSFPEGLDVTSTTLYVANSDYSAGSKPSISVINLSTGVDTPITGENIRNPQAVAAAGSDVFFLDWGMYDENWMQVNAGVYRASGSSVTAVIPNATGWAPVGQTIYTFNTPYGAATKEYQAYNIVTGAKQTFTDGADIFQPNAIGADPITGHVFIASYNENPDRQGYAGYAIDGYVIEYDATGKMLKKYACGVGPNAIVFNTAIAYIQ